MLVTVLQMPLFQPTLPLRGATHLSHGVGVDSVVSTHAPLAGSDYRKNWDIVMAAQFQPTLPLRGATWREIGEELRYSFQPTLPLRGATPSGASQSA